MRTDRRTDDEANSRFSQFFFFERASRSTVDKTIMFRSDLKRIQKCYPEIFVSSATVGPNVGFRC